MICVGIDVAKDKHDCFILNSEGVALADVFTIPNNLEGFHTLLDKLRACCAPQESIKVGLEATGHYSYNILGFLLDNGLTTYVLNPLRTNLYRKSLSLRKTKVEDLAGRRLQRPLWEKYGCGNPRCRQMLHWLQDARQVPGTAANHPPHPGAGR